MSTQHHDWFDLTEAMRSFLSGIHERSGHPVSARWGHYSLHTTLIDPATASLIQEGIQRGLLETAEAFDGLSDRLEIRLTESGRRSIGVHRHLGVLDRLEAMFKAIARRPG
ncbi:hypothetical protein [Rhizobium sp. SG2393]|uniref:hypothetical protein n=1 Tax=Rhizobium sp. SG2393 TaxID=3276279 RepID=UPI003672390D